MTPGSRLKGAKRVLAECKSPRLMLMLHDTHGYWPNVDYEYVRRALCPSGAGSNQKGRLRRDASDGIETDARARR